MPATQTRPPPYTLLLVDDAPAVRQALRWRVEDEADLAVIGEAGSGQEAISLAAALQPDVVILDIDLPDLDGYSVARHLKAAHPPPLVIFLTIHGDALARQRSREAQADGFAEKAQGWPSVIAQIRKALAAPRTGENRSQKL
jgi:DNA-binding NarL/FixJ family response regulator